MFAIPQSTMGVKKRLPSFLKTAFLHFITHHITEIPEHPGKGMNLFQSKHHLAINHP